LRELFACLLGGEGYRVITAEDGLIGLRIAEAQEPDLIITDIAMPRLDGVQMIKLMREQVGLSSIPIIAMSACHGDLTIALGAGADRVHPKPVELDVLLNELKALLVA
jgi:DNA-binding response OmpR family regulator